MNYYTPFLSIVIPCHNEAKNIRDTVYKVIRYGERNLMGRYEILLVENGSTDGTFLICKEMERVYRPVRAIHLEERSKAFAVRHGMLKARGEYRYMCDCDLSTPIDEVNHFLELMKDGWDMVIASREHSDSHVDNVIFTRWFMGRVFQSIVQNVTGLDYKDTQCGFKLFTSRAAVDIFSRAQCVSMAFDVEVLYLAMQFGFYCTDAPVTWRNDPDSRVRLFADSFSMFRDVLRIPKMHRNVQPAYKQKKVPA